MTPGMSESLQNLYQSGYRDGQQAATRRIKLLENLLARSLPLLRGHVHGSGMVERITEALANKEQQ